MKFYSYAFEHINPIDLFRLIHDQPYSLLFDSVDKNHINSRYSFIAYDPLETIEYKDGRVTVSNMDQTLSFQADPFEIASQRMALYLGDQKPRKKLPPFQGGIAGYFGYDLGRSIEVIEQHTTDLYKKPDMALGIYNKVFALDHKTQKAWLMVFAQTDDHALQIKRKFQGLVEQVRVTPAQQKETISLQDIHWTSSHSRDEYIKDTQKVIDYIYAGDIFQANLSQRFTAKRPDHFDPYDHYCALREISASPFASYMNFGHTQISSVSPERFLSMHNRIVETRPIKGTRPRMDSKQHDEFYRNELLNSEKDRAENAMIVDLLRNDISKICTDHSVEVPELCVLESFSNVHHLVSTVTGQLRADQSAFDLLKACFPGGSITGAPKIRAIEIIEELEDDRRGVYCGSLGYITPSGTMDTNIVIRTLIHHENHMCFNVGGGIVYDSKPEDEYQETLDKAASIFKSFEMYCEDSSALEKKKAA